MFESFHRFNVHVAIFVALVMVMEFGLMILSPAPDLAFQFVVFILLLHWLLLPAYGIWRLVLRIRHIPLAPLRGAYCLSFPTLALGLWVGTALLLQTIR